MNMKKDIYLDNASTTMLSPAVIKAMNDFRARNLGNASSVHKLGVEAAREVEKARDILARALNANDQEIIFTSGGTEANNLALRGIAFAHKEKGNHIIISGIEHSSVRETAYWLKSQGFEISEIPVDRHGFCNLNALEKEIRRETILVSIMHANNEVGTIQDLEAISELCRKNEIFFHTDACQSFGKVPIDVLKIQMDLISISSHKIHGPTGIGALYVRRGTKLEPIMFGGKQEQGLRSGTYHVEGIVGFGAAILELNDSDIERMKSNRDRLIHEICKFTGITLNGSSERLCNNVNVSLRNHSAKNVLLELSKRGIYLSVGSACSAGKKNPSHVLLAMGADENSARESLRISLSKYTSAEDIDEFLRHLREVLAL